MEDFIAITVIIVVIIIMFISVRIEYKDDSASQSSEKNTIILKKCMEYDSQTGSCIKGIDTKNRLIIIKKENDEKK